MSDPFQEGLEGAKARRLRSLMIAAALLVFVVLIFVVTIAKLATHTANGV
jgi:hypothetical protein